MAPLYPNWRASVDKVGVQTRYTPRWSDAFPDMDNLQVRVLRLAVTALHRFSMLVGLGDDSRNRGELRRKATGDVLFRGFASGGRENTRLPVVRHEVRKTILSGQKNSGKHGISLLAGDPTRIELDFDAEPTRFLSFLFLLAASLLKPEGLAAVHQRRSA